MKKIFYIFAASLLCLAACNEKLEERVDNQLAPEEEQWVTVRFNASFPDISKEVATRAAMADSPVVENMYVAIFGADGGKLQHWLPATFVQQGNSHTPETVYAYEVQIPLSDEERHIHFIANYPGSQPPLFEYEKTVMDKMMTTGGEGAYWQKIVMDKITGTLVDGAYVASPETQAAFQRIAFVRNYAKINLTTTSPVMTIEKYMLINVPNDGYIAPYNKGYNTPYMNIDKYYGNVVDSQNYTFTTALDSAHYLGCMPPTGIDTAYPGADKAVDPTQVDGLFMYERPVPDQAKTQTAVIAKIKWAANDGTNYTGENAANITLAGHTYYYKLELLDSDGEYFPIRRNVYYTFSLNKLVGDGEGEDADEATGFKAAYDGAFFGNVSASLETATLNELTDNTSKIVVNRMDYTAVTSGDVVDIYFQYYPEKNGTPVLSTSGDVSVSKRSVEGYDAAIASFEDLGATSTGTPDGTQWGHLRVTLNAVPESGMLRSKLRVQGESEGKRVLYRDIVFTVMSKQNFTSESAVSYDSSAGTVTVTIGLPENMPYSIFPLQVKIEAEQRNLTTTSELLPVSYGTSAFGSGKSFYFIRTISYSEYCKIVDGAYSYTTTFPCSLLMIDKKGTKISLRDYSDKYFVPKDDLVLTVE